MKPTDKDMQDEITKPETLLFLVRESEYAEKVMDQLKRNLENGLDPNEGMTAADLRRFAAFQQNSPAAILCLASALLTARQEARENRAAPKQEDPQPVSPFAFVVSGPTTKN